MEVRVTSAECLQAPEDHGPVTTPKSLHIGNTETLTWQSRKDIIERWADVMGRLHQFEVTNPRCRSYVTKCGHFMDRPFFPLILLVLLFVQVPVSLKNSLQIYFQIKYNFISSMYRLSASNCQSVNALLISW